MSNYTKTTDFAAKDALLTGNPSKLVKGTEINVEFSNIQTAVNSKLDSSGVTAFAATLLDDIDAATARGTLGAAVAGALGSSGITGAAASGANADITSMTALSSINGGQLAGLRNRIINGGMQVAQRGFVLPTANSVQYAMDRFYGYNQSASISGGAIGQQSNAGSSTGLFGGYLSFSAINLTTLAIGQRVESFNSIPLNGKTVTVSAVVYQDTGSALNGYFQLVKPTVLDNYGSKTVIVTQGVVSIPHATPTKVTYTVTLGASDASLGLEVDWNFVTSGNYINKYFMISDVQLEIGSVATTFEQRPYGMELALCQRYYYRVTPGLAAVVFGAGVAITTLNAYSTVTFPCTMRIAPTTIETTGTPADYKVYIISTAGYVNCNNLPSNATVTNFAATVAWSAGGTSFVAGNGTLCAANANAAYLGWSAEL